MGGSPVDVSDEPSTYEKRKKGWRMSSDVDKASQAQEKCQEIWATFIPGYHMAIIYHPKGNSVKTWT